MVQSPLPLDRLVEGRTKKVDKRKINQNWRLRDEWPLWPFQRYKAHVQIAAVNDVTSIAAFADSFETASLD